MLAVTMKGDCARFQIPSDADGVAEAGRAFACFLRARGLSDSAPPALVFRELVRNAAFHGNGGRADRFVNVDVEALDGPTFSICVRDGGPGFDHANLDVRLPEDPRHMANRGFAVVYALSEHVGFNDAGNEVTAHVRPEPAETST